VEVWVGVGVWWVVWKYGLVWVWEVDLVFVTPVLVWYGTKILESLE